jgi:hypothetical protein
VYENIFCYGDVCLTKHNEDKTVVALKFCTDVVAHNIQVLGTDKPKTGLKRIVNKMPNIYGLCLGTDYGIMVMNDFVASGRQFGAQKI